ncbi:hypothetical protein BGZ72_006309 [Mortierella alpina]|nr:hypothetical protein BGZ72_006309 [Mortierella alpina]
MGLHSADGHIPYIRFNDTKLSELGVYDPGDAKGKTVESSNAWTYDIPTSSTSELSTLELKMGFAGKARVHFMPETVPQSLDDGICMAYLAWIPEYSMLNSEARAGAITGDLLYLCGYAWYYSGTTMGGKHLRCGWMDGDNTNGNSVYGMLLSTDVFGSGYFKSYANKYRYSGDYCNMGITFYPGPYPLPFHRKRSLSKDEFGNNAYITTGPGAIELCDSPTSWGRSMLSLQEGVFCDMTTKTKVPICRDGQTEGCMVYEHSRRSKRSLHNAQGSATAVNVTQEALSYRFYNLEYFVVSDLNGNVIDDGGA